MIWNFRGPHRGTLNKHKETCLLWRIHPDIQEPGLDLKWGPQNTTDYGQSQGSSSIKKQLKGQEIVQQVGFWIVHILCGSPTSPIWPLSTTRSNFSEWGVSVEHFWVYPLSQPPKHLMLPFHPGCLIWVVSSRVEEHQSNLRYYVQKTKDTENGSKLGNLFLRWLPLDVWENRETVLPFKIQLDNAFKGSVCKDSFPKGPQEEYCRNPRNRAGGVLALQVHGWFPASYMLPPTLPTRSILTLCVS